MPRVCGSSGCDARDSRTAEPGPGCLTRPDSGRKGALPSQAARSDVWMSPARVTRLRSTGLNHTFNVQRLLLFSGMLAQERGLELQQRPGSVRQRSQGSVAVPWSVLGKTLHKQTQICFPARWFCYYVSTILQAMLGITEAFLAHYNFCAMCFLLGMSFLLNSS